MPSIEKRTEFSDGKHIGNILAELTDLISKKRVWLQDVARNCLVPREDEAKFRAVFLDDFLQHLPEKV